MGKARKAERTPAQLELDIVRIVELKNAGRTSEEIARVLNEGREPEQHIQPATVRSQWAAYSKRLLRPKTEESAAKLLSNSLARHQMLFQEAMRGYADFLRAGNPAAGTLMMAAGREQREIDRLSGVKPHEQKEGQEGADSGKPFETPAEGMAYLTGPGQLGRRILPFADSGKKRAKA
jgi:hypothetical protein